MCKRLKNYRSERYVKKFYFRELKEKSFLKLRCIELL